MDDDTKTPLPSEAPQGPETTTAPAAPRGRRATRTEEPAVAKEEVETAPPVPEKPRGLPNDVKARLKRRVLALQGPELGQPALSEQSAAVLLAHLLFSHENPEEVEHLGESEIIHMALNFKRLNPVVWFPLQSGHLAGLQAAFERSEIKANVSEYAELAALILGN